jgi:hypothetical protein
MVNRANEPPVPDDPSVEVDELSPFSHEAKIATKKIQNIVRFIKFVF